MRVDERVVADQVRLAALEGHLGDQGRGAARVPAPAAGTDQRVVHGPVHRDAGSLHPAKQPLDERDVVLLGHCVHQGGVRARGSLNTCRLHAVKPRHCERDVATVGACVDHRTVAHRVNLHVRSDHVLDPELCPGCILRSSTCSDDGVVGHDIWLQTGLRHLVEQCLYASNITALCEGFDGCVEAVALKRYSDGAHLREVLRGAEQVPTGNVQSYQ
mmetsp:Transcript_81407/g.225448  ORF Transcript_81407/g.225448 Transcript_81407/m.225448 type:complete len:216 (-) Transcript_81407:1205-1852(-)